jgi:hypothetical protein
MAYRLQRYISWLLTAPLDKSLGDLMPTLHEKRLREFHEDEVQLALRPSGIDEAVSILSIFIWFRWNTTTKCHLRKREDFSP